jgi:hypothetical protein
MYFFRLDWDTLQYSFDDLNRLFRSDMKSDMQFQAFLHAINRVYDSKDCHFMSPAILCFVTPVDMYNDIFDATKALLPMVIPSGPQPLVSGGRWHCWCPSGVTAWEDNQVIFESPCYPITATDMLKALELNIDDNIEKKNMLALLAGVVDYPYIPNGIFTAVLVRK